MLCRVRIEKAGDTVLSGARTIAAGGEPATAQ